MKKQTPSAAAILMISQRKSSRCSRKDFTGPPPSVASGGSGKESAMKTGNQPGTSNDLGFRRQRGRRHGGLGGGVGRRPFGRGSLRLLVFHRIRHFARSFFKFVDALAQTLGKLGNPFRAEQNQDHHHHDQQFSSAQSQQCKK